MSRTMMMVSARLTFFCVGSRKSLTPFETASTRDGHVAPLARVGQRRRKHRRAHGQMWGLDDDRDRMAAGSEGTRARSYADDEQQSADEEWWRCAEEGGASVLDASDVDEGEDERDGETERECMGVECGKGGDQRPHTAEIPTSLVNVVDHKRRRRQQTSVGAEENAISFADRHGFSFVRTDIYCLPSRSRRPSARQSWKKLTTFSLSRLEQLVSGLHRNELQDGDPLWSERLRIP